MKKIYGIVALLLLMVSVVGITYSYEYNDSESLIFKLNGSYILDLNLNDKYVEYGIVALKDGVDISSSVSIDSSSVNMDKVGEYKVKYEIFFDDYSEILYRIINVREDIKPEIKLLGELIIELNIGDVYIEPGYEVSDNYDMYLYDKVNVTSNLLVNQIGEYTIEYSVVDSSGNMGIAIRKIIIK